MSEKRILLGNEAIARGAYEAGVKVSAAYPGTPSTEVSESLVQYDEIYAEWAPNEKVATEVAIGASIAGVRSMCVMKHVGMNVAADPLYTAAYTGVLSRRSLSGIKGRTSIRGGYSYRHYCCRSLRSCQKKKCVRRKCYYPVYRSLFRSDCGRSDLHTSCSLYPSGKISRDDGYLHAGVHQFPAGWCIGNPVPNSYPEIFRK